MPVESASAWSDEMASSSISYSASPSPSWPWKEYEPSYANPNAPQSASPVSLESAVASETSSATHDFFTSQTGVGVGAGVGAVVVLALISICCCVRLRRRRRRAARDLEEKSSRPTRGLAAEGHLDLLSDDSYMNTLPSDSQVSFSIPVSPQDSVHLRHARSFQAGGMPFERIAGSHSTIRNSVTATDSEFDAFAVDGSSLARTLTNTSTSDSDWRGARGQRRLSNTDSSPPASLHRVMRYAGDGTPSGTYDSSSAQSTVLRTPATRFNSDPFRNPSPPLPPLPTQARRGYPYPPPTESAPSIASEDDNEWQTRPVSMFGGSENNDQERMVPPSYADLYGQDGLRQ